MHTNRTVVRLEVLTLFPDGTRLTPPGIYKPNLERLRKMFNRVLLSTAKTHENILNLRVGIVSRDEPLMKSDGGIVLRRKNITVSNPVPRSTRSFSSQRRPTPL